MRRRRRQCDEKQAKMEEGMDEGLHRDGVRQSEAARGHSQLLLSAQDNHSSH